MKATAAPPCPCVLTLRRELPVVHFEGSPVGTAEGLESGGFRTLLGKTRDHFLHVTEGEPDLHEVPEGLEGECGIVGKEVSEVTVSLDGAAGGWGLVAQDHHGLKLGSLEGPQELSVAADRFLVCILGASCGEKLCP